MRTVGYLVKGKSAQAAEPEVAPEQAAPAEPEVAPEQKAQKPKGGRPNKDYWLAECAALGIEIEDPKAYNIPQLVEMVNAAKAEQAEAE